MISIPKTIVFSFFFCFKVFSHHTTVVYHQGNVDVVDRYHHGHVHEKVYVNDPWYHPQHVYIYNGDPYANWYDGYPYYYYDPRFYYSEPSSFNINVNLRG